MMKSLQLTLNDQSLLCFISYFFAAILAFISYWVQVSVENESEKEEIN